MANTGILYRIYIETIFFIKTLFHPKSIFDQKMKDFPPIFVIKMFSPQKAF
jgi:hypothetical protein